MCAFRFSPDMVKALVKEAKHLKLTQVQVLEIAVGHWLATPEPKRPKYGRVAGQWRGEKS